MRGLHLVIENGWSLRCITFAVPHNREKSGIVYLKFNRNQETNCRFLTNHFSPGSGWLGWMKTTKTHTQSIFFKGQRAKLDSAPGRGNKLLDQIWKSLPLKNDFDPSHKMKMKLSLTQLRKKIIYLVGFLDVLLAIIATTNC